jgi:hypothetical protein
MYSKDLETLKNALGTDIPESLKKTLTAATGFVGYNLEPTAKLMLPLFAGFRNRLAVDTPAMGAKEATWRMMLGYGSFAFGTNMGTAFAGVGAATTPTSVSVSAAYKSQAIEGDVEFEATQMARGFDDAMAIETSVALSSLVKLDELLCLGGNIDALTPPVIAGSVSTLANPATFTVGNWDIKVTALTMQGCLTNASGPSNVGESAVSNTVTLAGGAGVTFFDISWPAVPGALGYKVYCSHAAAGAVYLAHPNTDLYYKNTLAALGAAIVVPTGQTFVTVNHVQIVSPPTATTLGSAGDASASTIQYDGIVNWAQKDTLYTQALGTHIKKDLDGAVLTTAGSGISEFDYILQNMWNTWVINPSIIITSAQGATSLTDKLVAANSAAMYRFDVTNNANGFTGGLFVGGYLNKFAASMLGQGPATIPVWAHPYMPDGTFLFLTERVPYQYSREARGFALDVMTPYTYFELGRTQRSFPFSVFFTQTLKCYHPLAQAAIVGARVA